MWQKFFGKSIYVCLLHPPLVGLSIVIPRPAVQTKNMSTKQKNEIIRECVEDHISPVELGRRHHMTADTIRAWVRKAGMNLPKTYRRSEVRKTAGAAGQVEASARHRNDFFSCLLNKCSRNILLGPDQFLRHCDTPVEVSQAYFTLPYLILPKSYSVLLGITVFYCTLCLGDDGVENSNLSCQLTLFVYYLKTLMFQYTKITKGLDTTTRSCPQACYIQLSQKFIIY